MPLRRWIIYIFSFVCFPFLSVFVIKWSNADNDLSELPDLGWSWNSNWVVTLWITLWCFWSLRRTTKCVHLYLRWKVRYLSKIFLIFFFFFRKYNFLHFTKRNLVYCVYEIQILQSQHLRLKLVVFNFIFVYERSKGKADVRALVRLPFQHSSCETEENPRLLLWKIAVSMYVFFYDLNL